MKKLYTGNIKKLSFKNFEVNPSAFRKIAFDSVVVDKDALFFINCMGVPISVDYNTKLLTREEAEDFVEYLVEKHPNDPNLATCIYADEEFSFSHEVTRKELKKLFKDKKAERLAKRKGN